ncbi:MAG: PAS domain S-box protein, partial [Nitrospirae bacterium]
MKLDELLRVLDIVPDYAFLLTEEGDIIRFNRLVEEGLGYRRDDLSGSKATKLHPPEFSEDVIRTIGEILRGEKDICTLPLIGKSGEIIPAETRISRIKLDGKDMLLALSRDISQRIEYEKRLDEKQEYLERLISEWDTIFNSINDLISIHDKDFRIVRANRALLEFLGMSEDEIRGKHCYE